TCWFSRCTAHTNAPSCGRESVGRVGGHSNNSDRGAPPLVQLQKLAVLAKSAPVEEAEIAPLEPWSLSRRLDNATMAELVRKYEAGIGTPQLCREYKLSKYSVLKVLHEAGVAMRRQTL